MVPVRPICVNLGLDRKWQQEKIKSTPELLQLGGTFKAMANDGKSYEMLCLNLRGIQMWLWSISDTPNLNKLLLEEYRKYLAIDIQEVLSGMLKVSLDEVERLRALNTVNTQSLEIARQYMEAEEQGRELTRQAKDFFKQAKDLKQEFVKSRETPNQLQLFN
jgi:hypothetical protein